MAEKNYYFLKLPEDFFRTLEIKKLRKIGGGQLYTNIYLKLMLVSLQNGGKLFYQGIEDTFVKELALLLDEEVDNVAMTIQFLLINGLLEETGKTEALLTAVPEMIIKDTADAKRMRMRRQREKLAEQGLLLETLENGESEQCSNNVQQRSKHVVNNIFFSNGINHYKTTQTQNHPLGTLENRQSEQCSNNVQQRSKMFTDIDIDIDIESVSQKEKLYSNSIHSEKERQTDDLEKFLLYGSRKNIPLTETEYQDLLRDYGNVLSELLEFVSVKLDQRKSGTPITSFPGYIRQVALDKGFKTTHAQQKEEQDAQQQKIETFLKKLNTFAEAGAVPNKDDFEKAQELGVEQEELIKITEKAKKVIEQRKNE